MRKLMMTAGGAAAVAVGLAAATAHGACDPGWQANVGIPGANTTVWTVLAVDEPSAIGPAVYMAGQASSSGGGSTTNIARWDGATWSPLGAQTTNTGTVYALAARDGILYVAGGFTHMAGQASTRGIAQWDGADWSGVGTGLSTGTTLRALAFYGDDLYVGGLQNDIGGVSARKIARWNGAAWSALPGNPLTTLDKVYALATFDDGAGEALYVGGDFDSAAGNSNAVNIFRFDGANYSPLGRGANGEVDALAVWNGSLYVGGYFTRVYQSDGTELVANKIARWDGAQWHAVGSGMSSGTGYYVWGLQAFDDGAGDALYAGGSFITAGGASIKYLARWNGAAWSGVGSSNLNGYVYALSASLNDGGLYFGGTFTSAGTPSANRVARWGRTLPEPPEAITTEEPVIPIGSSSTLNTTAGGATINWYTGGCGDTWIGAGETLKVTPAETTTYYAQAVDGDCASYACAEITIVVDCTPDAPTDAAAVPSTIFVGESSTLSATAPGAEIHWFSAGCGDTLVGTTGTLPVSPTETTTYFAQAWNGYCYSEACDSVTVTVNCIPLIITQEPQGGVICPNGPAQVELCVAAEGNGELHYQWRRNGFALIGANAACFTATQAGSYSCLVNDDCEPVPSQVAVVALADPVGGDFNGDGAVGVADLALLTPCLTGPASDLEAGACACTDVVPDGRLDLLDFAVLQTLIGE